MSNVSIVSPYEAVSLAILHINVTKEKSTRLTDRRQAAVNANSKELLLEPHGDGVDFQPRGVAPHHFKCEHGELAAPEQRHTQPT